MHCNLLCLPHLVSSLGLEMHLVVRDVHLQSMCLIFQLFQVSRLLQERIVMQCFINEPNVEVHTFLLSVRVKFDAVNGLESCEVGKSA